MNNLEAVPDFVADVVREEIDYQSLHAGHEYVDNYRAYRYHDEYNKANFDQAERLGCCGSSQSSVKIAGETWIIGWNYGH